MTIADLVASLWFWVLSSALSELSLVAMVRWFHTFYNLIDRNGKVQSPLLSNLGEILKCYGCGFGGQAICNADGINEMLLLPENCSLMDSVFLIGKFGRLAFRM